MYGTEYWIVFINCRGKICARKMKFWGSCRFTRKERITKNKTDRKIKVEGMC